MDRVSEKRKKMSNQSVKTTGKSPCYKCENRVIGCHAECEVYNAWKSKTKIESEAERMRRKADRLDPRILIRPTSIDNRIKERMKK